MYEFANWIFNIGISAICITVENAYNNKIEKPHNENNNNKRVYVHTYHEELNVLYVTMIVRQLQNADSDKWDMVRRHKLCKTCLFKHGGECKKKSQCGVEGCQYYHHSSLHRYSNAENNISSSSTVNNNNNKDENTTGTIEVVNTHCDGIKQVLFKIIPIKVFRNNKSVNTYAFIDEGSSISLMDNT